MVSAAVGTEAVVRGRARLAGGGAAELFGVSLDREFIELVEIDLCRR
jgi:hypothetical protein